MKWFKGRQPERYTLFDGQQLACTVCGNELFTKSSFKLNTSGMEILDLGWANKNATCLICSRCRHIHWFSF